MATEPDTLLTPPAAVGGSAALVEPTGGRAAAGPASARAVHRQGATRWRFLIAALVTGGVWWAAGDQPAWRGLVVLGCLAGPLPLLVQEVRRRRTAVAVWREGLRFASGTTVTWSAVVAVRRRGYVGQEPGPPPPAGAGRRLGRWLARALWWPIRLVGSAVLLCSPWHPRVELILAGGRRLVLHDLSGARAFSNAVHARICRWPEPAWSAPEGRNPAGRR